MLLCCSLKLRVLLALPQVKSMFDKVARQPLQLPICDVAWLPRLLSDDSNGNGKQLIPERHPLKGKPPWHVSILLEFCVILTREHGPRSEKGALAALCKIISVVVTVTLGNLQFLCVRRKPESLDCSRCKSQISYIFS